MDLAKMNNTERLQLCRKYFFIGFLGLPFLWLVNSVWFGSYIFFNDGNFDTKRSKRNLSVNSSNSSQNRTTMNDPTIAAAGITQPTAGNSSAPPSPSATSAAPGANPAATATENDEENKKCLRQIRSYVIFSFLGSMVWTVVIISWIVIFQVKRAEWGEFGDKISFNIPRGIP